MNTAQPTLETSLVVLRPMLTTDKQDFLQLAQDSQMWYYFTLNLSDEKQLEHWMEIAANEKRAQVRFPFTIIEKSTGKIAGSMSIGNISAFDLRAEIGWSWLGSEYRATEINRHAKYAMLRYIFEALQFERVEFKTDEENKRARRGLEKIGGKQEGILRSHMTMWNDRRRTSAVYSILKLEWHGLKESIYHDIV